MANSKKKIKRKRKMAWVFAKIKCRLSLDPTKAEAEARAIIGSEQLGPNEIFIEKLWSPYFDEKQKDYLY